MSVRFKIATKIKKERQKSGLSQTELAALCGWNQQAQSRLESGRASFNGVRQLCLLALALGVSLLDLLPPLEEEGTE